MNTCSYFAKYFSYFAEYWRMIWWILRRTKEWEEERVYLYAFNMREEAQALIAGEAMLVVAGADVPLEKESEAGVLFRTVRLIGGVIAVTSIVLGESTNTCSINPRAGILEFIVLCSNLICVDMLKVNCRFLRDLALPHDEGDGWKLDPLARHCKHLEKLNVSFWFKLTDSWVLYVAVRCTTLSAMVVSLRGKLSTCRGTWWGACFVGLRRHSSFRRIPDRLHTDILLVISASSAVIISGMEMLFVVFNSQKLCWWARCSTLPRDHRPHESVVLVTNESNAVNSNFVRFTLVHDGTYLFWLTNVKGCTWISVRGGHVNQFALWPVGF